MTHSKDLNNTFGATRSGSAPPPEVPADLGLTAPARTGPSTKQPGRLQALRRRARHVWSDPHQSVSDTATLSTREIDQRHARAVVDLAGRVAAAALACGATAADSTALILRVARHFKVAVHADVTMSAVTITHARALDDNPITLLRTVASKTSDYRKLEMIEALVDDITSGGQGLTSARAELGRIMQLPRTYRRWVQTFAKGLLGFWATVLFGGDLAECLVAGLTTASVDLVGRLVRRLHAPEFFAQVGGAAVCGAVALVVMWARSAAAWVHMSPSLIVASGMISMLAGLSLTTAARDAIDGYFVTAAARLVEVATLTGGIVLGLTLTLWVGLELGVPAYFSPTSGVRPLWWLQVVASALIAVSFAVNNHLTPRTWMLAACFGVLAWGVSWWVGTGVNSPAATAGAAAFVAGLAAQTLNRVVRVPTIALVTAGVVSLVPGMALYRGLLGVVQINQGNSVSTDPASQLFQAVMVAVMLAAGASLGTIAGRPLSMPRDWGTRLALAQAWRRGRDNSMD